LFAPEMLRWQAALAGTEIDYRLLGPAIISKYY
jgi:hypothetical protein